MKSNLLISCFIAVAVHTLLFVLPLHRVGSSSASFVKPPLSLSIMSTESPEVAAPVVQVLAKPPEESFPLPKKKASVKESLRTEREALRERTPLTVPVPEPVISRAETAPDAMKSSAEGASVGTDAGGGESITDSQRHVAALGNQHGKDVIVYAKPRYRENPLPHYPKIARKRGYEGQALLRVEVLKTGQVGKIKLITSSGYEVLDRAALESVKGWTFIPGTKNAIRIDQWVMIPVRFSLK